MFPVDQMWVLQAKEQLGGTVTATQQGHMGVGWGAKDRGMEGGF